MWTDEKFEMEARYSKKKWDRMAKQGIAYSSISVDEGHLSISSEIDNNIPETHLKKSFSATPRGWNYRWEAKCFFGPLKLKIEHT